MRIEFLGVRGEIESSLPNYRYHSGVLVDDQLLLDLGELDFLLRHPKWVLLSHLHPDHAAFVTHPPLPLDAPPIYAPESSPMGQVQVAIQPFTLGPYHITPIPTQHSYRVRSQGYRIDDGSSSLLFTGDILGLEEAFRPLFVHLDLAIIDGSFMRRGGMVRRDLDSGMPYGHTGIPDQIELLSHYTKRIAVTHFGEWFFKDPDKSKQDLEKLGTETGTKITCAYEGLILTL